MPWMTSTVVSRVLPSSMVITPSLPTLSIASAIIEPISVSPLAAIVATCFTCCRSAATLRAILWSASTTASLAARMPLDSWAMWAPDAANLWASRKMASARTVAVVVPSPATSEVLVAASLTSWAPMSS